MSGAAIDETRERLSDYRPPDLMKIKLYDLEVNH